MWKFHQTPRQLGRRRVTDLLDGEPGLLDGLGHRLVERAGQPNRIALDDLPGTVREQARSHPGRGDEHPEAPAGRAGHSAHGAGISSALIHSGAVSWMDAVSGAKVPYRGLTSTSRAPIASVIAAPSASVI